MERQEENREMQDHLARMEALLMQHLGIRPHVPPTPRPPLSPVTEGSGPQSDDQPGHLMTDVTPSQSAHLDDHQPGHWTDPHGEMPEDRHHLLDDHDEFMSQLMPPPSTKKSKISIPLQSRIMCKKNLHFQVPLNNATEPSIPNAGEISPEELEKDIENDVLPAGQGSQLQKCLLERSFIRFDANGRFAHICLEVDFAIPLRLMILVNKEEQVVECESLHVICFSCGRFGRSVENCGFGSLDERLMAGKAPCEVQPPPPYQSGKTDPGPSDLHTYDNPEIKPYVL
ncbi:hypothetical protein Syun_023975 [Stephania yunnanensis]|uniref:CCHC-type domain-containing protein n=1 Tax=Stephania yunnanensis TaxID=152371 RepID=A0AAP0FQU9_9MAGN